MNNDKKNKLKKIIGENADDEGEFLKFSSSCFFHKEYPALQIP